jgi:hypothetical protein
MTKSLVIKENQVIYPSSADWKFTLQKLTFIVKKT